MQWIWLFYNKSKLNQKKLPKRLHEDQLRFCLGLQIAGANVDTIIMPRVPSVFYEKKKHFWTFRRFERDFI